MIVSPKAAYSALVRGQAPSTRFARSGQAGWLTAFRRPLLVTAVIGASLAIAATGRATPALVASTTLTWSYMVLVQLAVALPVVARARRTVGFARGLDLFFAGHAPWSFSALAAAAWAPSPFGRPFWPLAGCASVPVVLTRRIIPAFCAEVSGMNRRDALRTTAVHEAMTWTLFAAWLGHERVDAARTNRWARGAAWARARRRHGGCAAGMSARVPPRESTTSLGYVVPAGDFHARLS